MKPRSAIVAIAALVALLPGLLLFSCTRPAEPAKTESLRIGVYEDPVCALLYVAREKGIFRRHGLDVSLESYQAGAYAVDDLLAGKVDLATASGFVLALRTFQHPDLRAIGTVSAAETNEIVALRERGVEKPGDLRGKRIGVSRGTNNEFFLGTFLSYNGILAEEVQTVDLRPADLAAALSGGRIDAAVLFGPSLAESKRRLGAKAVSWSVQSGQDFFFLLLCRDDLIRARPEALTSLLRGVLEAEEYLKRHDREARSITAQALRLAPEEVDYTWSRTRFRVRFDEDMLTLMEDEVRWAMKNGLVEAEMMPNFLTSLHLDGLERLKPEAVTVVH